MTKPAIDLDKCAEDRTDYELQRRSVLTKADGIVRVVWYAWLSKERKEQNHSEWSSKFTPFYAKDKVTATIGGMKLSGKIISVDTNYYDGDCHVLYVDLDKRSSKKWVDYREAQKVAA